MGRRSARSSLSSRASIFSSTWARWRASATTWARDGRLPGFGFARSYDAGSMIDAPVLSYYRNTGVRLSVPWRQFAGLPDDQLMPGERLIVESVSRDQRDQLRPLGITKNARVVVLEQRSRYQALIVTESALDADADREALMTSAITVSLGVSYPADDLRNAGVVLAVNLAALGLTARARSRQRVGNIVAAGEPIFHLYDDAATPNGRKWCSEPRGLLSRTQPSLSR